MKLNSNWPVMRNYSKSNLDCIAMPIGGIGTGSVSIGGRGNLRDWEIMNKPAKDSMIESRFLLTGRCLFALYTEVSDKKDTRIVEGVISPPYEGSHGLGGELPGGPRFRNCSFHSAYPFGQVCLSDPACPVDVRIEAFNPLIPNDVDSSSMPVCVMRFVLTNKTSQRVKASLCGIMRNFVGTNYIEGRPDRNKNIFKKTDNLCGIFMYSEGVDRYSPFRGNMTISTPEIKGVTYKLGFEPINWNMSLLHFWDDFSNDGRLEKESGDEPLGALAVPVNIAAKSEKEITFYITWWFPNRYTWTPAKTKCCDGKCELDKADIVGNYYTTVYRDSWDVAERFSREYKKLERMTVEFVSAFCESSLPVYVKEAALFNLSTLRTQTLFRTKDGYFFGWEGCCDNVGCCHGSCTHVWNYEQTTAFLFADIAKKMREVEFKYATDEQGLMHFRVNLPLKRAREFGKAAADGQLGCIAKIYRDWQLTGDDEMLKSLWQKIKKALEFCWIKGSWDSDKDGIMEGIQHNTMDVEYFGPNPQMQSWYLCALKCAEKMGRYLGDDEFADICRGLFENGSRWMDENLFNGEYYEHHIQKPRYVNRKLLSHLMVRMGTKDIDNPIYQLGKGCLIDQLVGQFFAHVCDIGHLVKSANVRKTLRSIMKYNFKKDFYSHFNHMRTFALNDEQALVMCSYPDGNRPKIPFPYFTEVMTGFEYVAAVGMIYEGMIRDGLKVIRAIRNRYDGRKRNPFDEAECGHHYARAMAAYGVIIALSGFHYSAVDGHIKFAPKINQKSFKCFWSIPSAWGIYQQKITKSQTKISIKVFAGQLKLKTLTVAGNKRKIKKVMINGKAIKDISQCGEKMEFGKEISISKDKALEAILS